MVQSLQMPMVGMGMGTRSIIANANGGAEGDHI